MPEGENKLPTLAKLVEALEYQASISKRTPEEIPIEDIEMYFVIRECELYDLQALAHMRRTQVIFCGDCQHCLGCNSHECDICMDYARRAHGPERMSERG